MIKKGDAVIIVVAVLLTVVSALMLFVFPKRGETVTVVADEKTVYSGSLFENRKIETGHNTVTIKNGEVFMAYSDCKNQICVNHLHISKKGETIVCVPNKVIVKVD